MKPNPLLFFSTILLAASLACNTVVPTDEPPGVGDKAERGYALSEPVIAALEQFKAETGAYPASLDELVPNYLPALPIDDELEFSYSTIGDSYSFSFHYRGPGLNTCTYIPEEQWQCSGAY